MSTHDHIIKARNIARTYMGTTPTIALKNATFDIKEGEFVGLMGRSGSGKSTLLHQLGLLDMPTSGELVIDGIDVLSLSENEKSLFRLNHLGYVFQEYALIAEFTALENVCFPAMASGRVNSEGRAIELLTLVGLGKRIHHYPQELSGGEQQRIAIARALINNPRVLFADEPTANLDTASSEMICLLFKKLNSI